MVDDYREATHCTEGTDDILGGSPVPPRPQRILAIGTQPTHKQTTLFRSHAT